MFKSGVGGSPFAERNFHPHTTRRLTGAQRTHYVTRFRDRVKILYWDRDGFAVWAKRLEEGTYSMPFSEVAESRCEISAQELGALLSGIDLSQAKRRKRY